MRYARRNESLQGVLAELHSERYQLIAVQFGIWLCVGTASEAAAGEPAAGEAGARRTATGQETARPAAGGQATARASAAASPRAPPSGAAHKPRR